jgi:hypothetical protein
MQDRPTVSSHTYVYYTWKLKVEARAADSRFLLRGFGDLWLWPFFDSGFGDSDDHVPAKEWSALFHAVRCGSARFVEALQVRRKCKLPMRKRLEGKAHRSTGPETWNRSRGHKIRHKPAGGLPIRKITVRNGTNNPLGRPKARDGKGNSRYRWRNAGTDVHPEMCSEKDTAKQREARIRCAE